MKEVKNRVSILGDLPCDALSRAELFCYITKNIKQKQKSLILYNNVYAASLFWKINEVKKLFNRADMIVADGMGIVFASSLNRDSRQRLFERLNVGDFLWPLLKHLSYKKSPLKVFILGGETALLEHMKQKFKEIPGLELVASHHGYFESSEERKIVKKIQTSRADLVLLAMGMPKQEIFLARHYEDLPSASYLIVGAALQYLLGRSRAPLFFQKFGLEWFYRVIQEPRRLFMRYFTSNLIFLRHCLQFLYRQYMIK